MLQVFITETGNSLTNLEQAFEQKDMKQVKFLAHRMKSSLNNLNIISAGSIAEKIEKSEWVESDFPALKKQIIALRKIIDKVIPMIMADYSELQG